MIFVLVLLVFIENRTDHKDDNDNDYDLVAAPSC
jgi:hypothetical protein